MEGSGRGRGGRPPLGVSGARRRREPGIVGGVDRAALAIADHPEAERYEARADGALAGFVDYRRLRNRLILVHTEVLPAHEGQGVASALARHVLTSARAAGARVTITCPYLHDFVERHPEFAPGPDGRIT